LRVSNLALPTRLATNTVRDLLIRRTCGTAATTISVKLVCGVADAGIVLALFSYLVGKVARCALAAHNLRGRRAPAVIPTKASFRVAGTCRAIASYISNLARPAVLRADSGDDLFIRSAGSAHAGTVIVKSMLIIANTRGGMVWVSDFIALSARGADTAIDLRGWWASAVVPGKAVARIAGTG